MDYQQLLKRLLSVNMHGGIKLGLSNSLKLNEALGSPVSQFPAIHVAGTNGKGSVVTKIAAALQAAGFRVGLYTSPHIACFRERIRINQEMILEHDVQKHLSHIFKLIDSHHIPATFFEITTLLAFAYFAEQKIDFAVIETGLGGRLDATNIVKPILTIITSISLEHTDILGSTIEEITNEKAGIIKPSIPIIIGPTVPFKQIQNISDKLASPCIAIKGSYEDFQNENNAITTAALNYLKVPDAAIQQGLKAIPPCRLQTWLPHQLSKLFPHIALPSAVILDVAHNPDGIQHLILAIKQRYPVSSLRFIIGLSKNKNISGCLSQLINIASHIHLVQANMDRAAPKEQLYNELLTLGYPQSKMTMEPSIPFAITHAINAAGQNKNEIVTVCGSFFIMADARAALGIQEPLDFSNLNERFDMISPK